jgi:Cof subfamily protein (haloacid dehalogenase superfamily)
MEPRIKLLAIDLDDTLLKSDLSLSGANKAAIRAATERGVRVVLASGRNIYSMKRYADELGLTSADDLMICTNGAEIVSIIDSKILYENKMSRSLCEEVVSLSRDFGLSWQIYAEGRILVSQKNQWTQRDTDLTGQPNECIQDRDAWFARGTLKMVLPGDPELIARAYPRFKSHFGARASVLVSKPYFLEVMDPHSDKGYALERVSGMLGVRREQTMAIGDSINDIGMVRWAGLGCAVGNALPELKAAAGLVADAHHEEDAVAWLIEKVGILR